jgi:hypothetical protein
VTPARVTQVVWLLAATGDIVHDVWTEVEGDWYGRQIVAVTAELFAALVSGDPPRAADLAAKARELAVDVNAPGGGQ